MGGEAAEGEGEGGRGGARPRGMGGLKAATGHDGRGGDVTRPQICARAGWLICGRRKRRKKKEGKMEQKRKIGGEKEEKIKDTEERNKRKKSRDEIKAERNERARVKGRVKTVTSLNTLFSATETQTRKTDTSQRTKATSYRKRESQHKPEEHLNSRKQSRISATHPSP